MLKPQDIVVLCACLAHPGEGMPIAALAGRCGLSASEAHGALGRLGESGLMDRPARRPWPGASLEFLVHGLRYAFPARLGRAARGLATGASAPPLLERFVGAKQVWPWASGPDEGESIEPLYPSVPEACSRDARLWEWLALADALRAGALRERKAAQAHLESRLLAKPA